jgi:Ca2+-binding RTX toxin-like protein
VGTRFDDSFTEGETKVRLDTGAGDDTVYGASGTRSAFNGGTGTDHLSYETLNARVIVDAGRGVARGDQAGWDRFENFEEITGSQADDFMSARSGSDWVLNGHDGNDVLKFKGDASGTLIGGAGNDKLVGLEGNDLLMGGAGNDAIFGNGGDDIITTGTGTDYAYGGRGNDLMTGASHRDFLRGNRGNDTLIGNGGADDLEGGASNDLLMGGSGADILQGGTHNDTLIGGADDDYLYGDEGQDVFVFLQGDGAQTDRVQDFALGEDLIDLTDYTFTNLSQLEITDAFNRARIDLGDDQIILLRSVTAAELSTDDFLF